MSSPIVEKSKNPFDRVLIGFHQRTSHKHRLQILADRISATLNALPEEIGRCLDIGCGDMSLAELLAGKVNGSQWNCIDIHTLPHTLVNELRWQKYQKFDGTHVPFADKTFSCALLCDVLHHASVSDQRDLLIEASRAANHVLVKDHFEYGWLSRQTLRLMDFVGNYGYGISVPERYFRQTTFSEITRAAGLQIQSMEIGISLYQHLPFASFALKSKWQFIAVLTRKSQGGH
jgi:hypothetical protein